MPANLTNADIDRRLEVCEAVVRSAGHVALEGFRTARDNPLTMKGPQDYLTETDAAVERHLKAALTSAFPGDSFLGEEEGGIAGEAAWVADPIDGTANFARGIPHWCISLAFVADGVIEIGAIHNPALGDFWIARRGAGATLNGRPMRVSTTTDFNSATVEIGWSPRLSNEVWLSAAGDVLARGANVRRAGSGALGIAYVADGRQDAYAELHMNAWDCLAGLLLVTEAGGVTNDFLDRPGALTAGNPVLASAPGIAKGLAESVGIKLDPHGPGERTAA